MQIETLKRSHLKRNIIIAVVIVLILSAVILTFTRAKYRTTESMPLLNGTINYTLADLNIVEMYLNGEAIDALPDGNYELTEESYCTNEKNVKDESITLSYDGSTKAFAVTPFNKKGTKCYLYFEEGASAGDYILANEGGAAAIEEKGIPDFSQRASTDEGMYAAEDDYGTSYYYRGDVNDNWFQFGTNSSEQQLYWRIIRINGDGTVRLIYNGTSVNEKGTGTQIGISAFNNSSNDNMYVGYMYQSGQPHGLTINSNIKLAIDNWYASNLADEVEYLDGNTGFCGDRYPSTSSSSSNGAGGTGTTTTYYGVYIRLYSNKNPSFKCIDTRDLYTTSGSSKGNKVLSNPIGLVSADEVAFAGGIYGSGNSSYYLYTGQNYWTMSPSHYNGANVFWVGSTGGLHYYYATSTNGVRPVINLRADVALSGSGTTTDPFKVVGAS